MITAEASITTVERLSHLRQYYEFVYKMFNATPRFIAILSMTHDLDVRRRRRFAGLPKGV